MGRDFTKRACGGAGKWERCKGTYCVGKGKTFDDKTGVARHILPECTDPSDDKLESDDESDECEESGIIE